MTSIHAKISELEAQKKQQRRRSDKERLALEVETARSQLAPLVAAQANFYDSRGVQEEVAQSWRLKPPQTERFDEIYASVRAYIGPTFLLSKHGPMKSPGAPLTVFSARI
jgi:hypothetical protein